MHGGANSRRQVSQSPRVHSRLHFLLADAGVYSTDIPTIVIFPNRAISSFLFAWFFPNQCYPFIIIFYSNQLPLRFIWRPSGRWRFIGSCFFSRLVSLPPKRFIFINVILYSSLSLSTYLHLFNFRYFASFLSMPRAPMCAHFLKQCRAIDEDRFLILPDKNKNEH